MVHGLLGGEAGDRSAQARRRFRRLLRLFLLLGLFSLFFVVVGVGGVVRVVFIIVFVSFVVVVVASSSLFAADTFEPKPAAAVAAAVPPVKAPQGLVDRARGRGGPRAEVGERGGSETLCC